MILSLDTSAAVDILRGRDPGVRDHFLAAQASGAQLRLSTVALYELAAGAKASSDPGRKLEELARFAEALELAAFDSDDAIVAGCLRADLEAPGRQIDHPDLMIGAQALHRGWAVVTSNLRHFVRLQGLELYDWRISDRPLDRADAIAGLFTRTKDK